MASFDRKICGQYWSFLPTSNMSHFWDSALAQLNLLLMYGRIDHPWITPPEGLAQRTDSKPIQSITWRITPRLEIDSRFPQSSQVLHSRDSVSTHRLEAAR